MKVRMKKLAVFLLAGTLVLSGFAQPAAVRAEEPEVQTEDALSQEEVKDEEQQGDLVKENKEEAVVVMTQGDVTNSYASVGEALKDVQDYSYSTNKAEYVITLQKDTKEDIVIPAKKKIRIDLNGNKITNVKSHTIYNNSTQITIVDTKGGGIVDNITHAKAAVYNNIKANITLQGGSFTRSAEASTGDLSSGNNSFYVLKNFGTMYIKSGTTVKFSDSNPGLYSSLVGNGWQDAASAEAGKNGEPKPSEGGKKATLKIYDGATLTGGQITVKNDDYGDLTVSGGTIIQPSEGRAAIANNNKATITGGTIEATGANGQAVYSRYFDTNGANEGQLTISGGSFKSTGTVVDAKKGSKLTVTDGVFETSGESSYIFSVQDNVTSSIQGGTYQGVTADRVANKKEAFAEGYGPVSDADGNLVVDVTEEGTVAIVKDKDGSMKRYVSLGSALSNATAGSTVSLQKNVVLTKGVATAKAPGITLDLNGYNIDGTEVKTADGVVCMQLTYGWKPVDGVESTMRVVNSQSTGGEIKGTLPLQFKSGDSTKEVKGEIGSGIQLTTLDQGADAVKLGSAAYLVYSDLSKDFIKNGGFQATAADGTEYIYGSYSYATEKAADGVVTLLHDYTGTDKIYSGSRSAVLDLGGNTYTHTGKDNVLIDVNYPNVEFTIRNGKIITTNSSCDGAQLVGAPNESQMNNRGLILDKVELTVPGDVYGIVTNGTETGNKVTLKDSVLNVKNGVGIYFPSAGDVVIDNSVINAKYTGVQMCAGNLTIKGDKTAITVTEKPQEKLEGDGSIADGAAISIVKRDGYKELGTVTIEGGTFKAASGVDAIKTYTFNNEDKTEGEWKEAGEVVEVEGGNFSTVVPENICGDKFIPTEVDPDTGLATVIKDTKAPEISLVNNGQYYGGKVTFTVTDDHEVASVIANDNELIAKDGEYTIEGAGTYHIVAADSVGNKTEVTIEVAADKGILSKDTAKVTLVNKLVANGKEQTQKVEVTVGGVLLAEGVDYEVTGNKATEAGTYTLKVTGIGNYEGSVEVEYTVEKKGTAVDPEDPEAPEDPSDPQKPGSQDPADKEDKTNDKDRKTNTVKTADTADVTGYMTVMLLAAGTVVLAMRRKQKR